jgi:alginate O-acetyltransferase complex protein AlgI
VLLALGRAWGARRQPLPVALSRPLTFLAVVAGWVVFRAASVHNAGSMLAGMVGLHGFGRAPRNPAATVSTVTEWVVLGALLVFVNVAPTTKQWVESRELNAWRAVGLGTLFFLALMLMRTALLSNTPSPFIYFQF